MNVELETELLADMEDDWMRDTTTTMRILEIRERVFNTYVGGVLKRQRAAQIEWEESMLFKNPPLVPKGKGEGVSHSRDVYFETFERDKGIPMGAVIAGRRELRRCLRDEHKKPFKELKKYYSMIRVRMKVSISTRSL